MSHAMRSMGDSTRSTFLAYGARPCHCGEPSSRFCLSRTCDSHCSDPQCPLHLPLLVLRSERGLPTTFVNGMWKCSLVAVPHPTMRLWATFMEQKTKLTARYGECVLCFQPLTSMCVLHDRDDKRVCSHIFHPKCFGEIISERVTTLSCPVCHASVSRINELPPITDFDCWWRLIAGNGNLEITEAIELCAALGVKVEIDQAAEIAIRANYSTINPRTSILGSKVEHRDALLCVNKTKFTNFISRVGVKLPNALPRKEE